MILLRRASRPAQFICLAVVCLHAAGCAPAVKSSSSSGSGERATSVIPDDSGHRRTLEFRSFPHLAAGAYGEALHLGGSERMWTGWQSESGVMSSVPIGPRRAFSFEAWVYLEEQPVQAPPILDRSDPGGLIAGEVLIEDEPYLWYIGITSDGHLVGPGLYDHERTPIRQWVHVTMSLGSGWMRMYRDGRLVDSIGWTSPYCWRTGCWGSVVIGPFGGMIDDVRLSGIVRNGRADGPHPIDAATLAIWRFDQGDESGR